VICTGDHSNVDQITKGKVIMHFSMGPVRPLTPDVVQKNGGIGLIYVRNPGDSRVECPVNFPCIYLDMEVGSELYTYIQTRRLFIFYKLCSVKLISHLLAYENLNCCFLAAQ